MFAVEFAPRMVTTQTWRALLKDMSDPSLSAYSGVDWSAPDDATIEGEFPLAPLSLRYTKAIRRLHLRLTEIAALETWGQRSRGGADAPTHELTARGELAEVHLQGAGRRRRPRRARRL